MDEDLRQRFELDGKVAVVTGAGSGIGRETAIVLARAGAEVVLADVSEVGLEETADEVAKATHRSATIRVTDVSRKAEVDALAQRAVDVSGKLDVWVNVAGILRHWLIVDASEQDLAETFAVNYFGTYWGIAAAGRVMTQARSGSIINVTSSGAEMAVPELSGYGCSKAAVAHLTKIAAAEFGPSGVRVNAVAPGWIETPMVSYHWTDSAGARDDEEHRATVERMAAMVPLGVAGEPQDIALSILFLASKASKFITGQTVRTNGGIPMG
jgi:3-oxoacyl-[acyl-carrier protein] reductase